MKNCTGDALTNYSVEITKMTLAGERTSIEVGSVDEAKNLLLLCKQKVELYNLVVNFVRVKEYEEIKSLFFQIIKSQFLQVCFSFSV